MGTEQIFEKGLRSEPGVFRSGKRALDLMGEEGPSAPRSGRTTSPGSAYSSSTAASVTMWRTVFEAVEAEVMSA